MTIFSEKKIRVPSVRAMTSNRPRMNDKRNFIKREIMLGRVIYIGMLVCLA